MKILGNIIWLVFGGFAIAIEYIVSSVIMMLTIIGIPFGLQTLKTNNLNNVNCLQLTLYLYKIIQDTLFMSIVASGSYLDPLNTSSVNFFSPIIKGFPYM